MTGEKQRRETVYLGLGSNLGDRESNLREALEAVDALESTRLLKVSPLYATEPRIVEQQPEFLNACAKIETALSPRKLLEALLDIEQQFGRERARDKGARTLDLDILLWEERLVDQPGLTVPHPGLGERAFVLVPLRDIAAEVRDPATGLTVEQLAARCTDDGDVERYDDP